MEIRNTPSLHSSWLHKDSSFASEQVKDLMHNYLYYVFNDKLIFKCYSEQRKKQGHRFGKERQCCRYIHTVQEIYIARMIFGEQLCPQPKRLNGLIRHALKRPDQVDIWDQVSLCAYWNDQNNRSNECLDCRLSEQTGGFFIFHRAILVTRAWDTRAKWNPASSWVQSPDEERTKLSGMPLWLTARKRGETADEKIYTKKQF